MDEKPTFKLRGDRPVESAKADRLGRAEFARALAEQILEAPALDSYVVAILGPWGCGKTSLMNMVAEEVQLKSDAVVLRFNPWIFSGAEQLVGFFFRELGAQFSELKTGKLSAVGGALEKYAGLFGSVAEFIPTIGGSLKKAADVVKGLPLRRVVLRLLRRVPDQQEREALVSRVLPSLRWLSGQSELIRIAEGHELASPSQAASWRKELAPMPVG